MPTLILNADRPTKKLILPSSRPNDEAWVEIYTNTQTQDMMQFDENDTKPQATVKTMASLIKDWNFKEKDGSKAPIDFDHVKLLTFDDFAYILSGLNLETPTALPDEIKKNTSSTSQPSTKKVSRKIRNR